MSEPLVSAKGRTGKGTRTPTRVKSKRAREPTGDDILTGEGPVTKTANREGDSARSTHVAAAQGSEFFTGIVVLLVQSGVQMGRLQVWRRQLENHGAQLSAHMSPAVSHVVAASWQNIADRLGSKRAAKLNQVAVSYNWVEESLKEGRLLPTTMYLLNPPDKKHRALSSSPPPQVSESQRVEATETFTPAPDPGQHQRNYSSSTEHSAGSPGRTAVMAGRGEIPQSSAQHHSNWLRVIRDSADIGRKAGRITSLEHSGSDGEMESRRRGGEESEGPPGGRLALGGPESHDRTYSPPNVNTRVTAIFTQLKDIYKDALRDDFRSFSYQKAVSVLEKLPFQITDVDQINGLPAVGPSLRDQIEEIVTSGKLQRLEKFKKEKMVQTIILFSSVHGIGPATAQTLYAKGHRTLEDLRKDPSLSAAQQLGLRFHSDIAKKVPRGEVAIMESLVQKAAQDLVPGISVLCGGSYRRGKLEVGDMDFVITHPDGCSQAAMLPRLLGMLRGVGEWGGGGFIAEELSTPSIRSLKDAEGGVDTFMGLCKFPGREQRHRIDIKVYPWKKYPFGLIAWTGNTVLNRRLRLVADTRGYVLDDHGLFPAVRDIHGQKVAQAEQGLPFGSEKEVFDFLGFKYLEPHERNL